MDHSAHTIEIRGNGLYCRTCGVSLTNWKNGRRKALDD